MAALNSITVLGSSSGRNAGDAALISGIMDSIDTACGTPLLYEIPTIRPGYITNNYKNRTRPVGMMPWQCSVKMLGLPTMASMLRTDLSLIFDAVLFDRSLFNPLFNFMSSIYLMAKLAKKRGKRLCCYNVGLGPVTTPTGRSMLRDLLEMMDFISVREESSYELLKELGVKNQNVLVGADAALTVTGSDPSRVKEIFDSVGLPFGQEIIGFNVNTYINTWAGAGQKTFSREEFIEIYAAAVNQVLAKLKVPAAFVATQHSDLALTHEIKDRVKSSNKVAVIDNVRFNHYEIKGALRHLSLLFGMRLHSQILASSELTPIIGLAFQSKVVHYYRALGLKDNCLSFDNFTENGLAEHILTGWHNRLRIKEVLSRRVPELQARALIAPQVIAAMHRGQDIDNFFDSSSNTPYGLTAER